MDITAINARIDNALAENRRAETLVIFMSVAIFSLGVAVVTVGYFVKNPYILGGAFIFQGFLVFPIRKILQIRRENVSLQALPILINALPKEKAAQEIINFIKFIRGEQ